MAHYSHNMVYDFACNWYECKECHINESVNAEENILIKVFHDKVCESIVAGKFVIMLPKKSTV